MALVPLQHSPADQGTPLYPTARQSILVRLVGKVMAQGQQQQQHKLYLHDYNYVVTVLQKL